MKRLASVLHNFIGGMPIKTKNTIIYCSLALVVFAVIISIGVSTEVDDHVGEAKIPLTQKQMKGEPYADVVEDFESAGFTNVKVEKLEDLITGWMTKDGEVEKVSVGAKEDFSSGQWVVNDTEVIITYRTFQEKEESSEPEKEESSSESSSTEISEKPAFDESILESSFPKENAKRAAIVALTNAYATDVFATDGNTYDTSKFHSYSDLSGDSMDLYAEGTWTPKNDNTWHVENLRLNNVNDILIVAELDVSCNGTDYTISNVTGTLGNNSDISEIEAGKNKPYLTVTPELISENRKIEDSEPGDKTIGTGWTNELFSSWDGSCADVNKLIKKSLNDEKSFKHIETSFVEITTEEVKTDISEILIAANIEASLNMNDVVIITEFSAKNGFDATVKNTAYSLATYKSKKIEILTIQ